MEAFQPLLDGVVGHPTAAMLVLALLALAFLFRQREADRAKADDRIAALNDAHKATIEKVIPVAEKLADGVTTLERLMLKGDH